MAQPVRRIRNHRPLTVSLTKESYDVIRAYQDVVFEFMGIRLTLGQIARSFIEAQIDKARKDIDKIRSKHGN